MDKDDARSDKAALVVIHFDSCDGFIFHADELNSVVKIRYPRFVPILFLGVFILGGWAGLLHATVTTGVDSSPSVSLTDHRVLILGDSITQDGRYVTLVEYFLHRMVPDKKTDFISIGLSSETVSGLSEKDHPFPRPCVLERLDRALKSVKPRVVVACYGMNDGIYHPLSPDRLAAFARGLRELIAQVRVAGAKLILLTPPVFDAQPIAARTVSANAAEFGYSKPYAGYDDVLTEFSKAELSLHEPGVTVIDLHDAMRSALTAQRVSNAAFTFASDGVHPNDSGHLLMARTLLQGLGYVLPTDSIERIQADAVFPLIRELRQLRSEAWLPFVGYVRGENFKSASVASAEMVVARLQTEIDAMVTKK